MMRNPELKLLLGAIRLYQWLLSPWIGNACRFQPTCSVYADEALRKHGAFKGMWLTLCRLLRCHPWGGSGYDPVPPASGDGKGGCPHEKNTLDTSTV